MGHWYSILGENRYGANLREARKEGYLPSVTTINKIIANPGLEIWKQNQVLEASLTLTRLPDEADKDFIRRVKDDSMAQARKAARLGNVIHKLAERYIMGKPLFFTGQRKDVWLIFDEVKKWIDSNLAVPDFGFMGTEEGAEVVVVNEKLGFAGKADFVGRHISGMKLLLDFKTTFLKPTHIKKNGNIKKTKIYPSWGRQLAALTTGETYVLSVIISTNPDCLGVFTYNWNDDELEKSWEEFKHALAIYKSVNRL